MDMTEIPETNGLYFATRDGRFFRRTATGYAELKVSVLQGRYPRVSIAGRAEGVHRVLALTFLPNPEGFKQVRHLDDNPLNNTLSNLAWGTPKQNTADRVRNGGDALTRAAAEQTRCKKGLHERTPENLVTRTKSDGRTTQTCKPCELERARQSYANNAEKRRAYARERVANETPEQREARLVYQREYRRAHR